MFYGIYLCLGGLFILLSIFLIPGVNTRRRLFLLLSVCSIMFGLLAFELFSSLLDIVEFRTERSVNIPADYISSGPIAWLILIIPILAISSPFIIALLFRKRNVPTPNQSMHMENQNQPITLPRTLEKTLFILAGVNCIVASTIFSYSEITHSEGQISSIFPFPGLYFIELIAIGILCVLAFFLLNNQSISTWSGITWVCSGLLLAFIILGAWTIGFFLIPGMLILLAAGILIDKRTQGEIALHLIYFIAAGLSQGVFVFLTLLI